MSLSLTPVERPASGISPVAVSVKSAWRFIPIRFPTSSRGGITRKMPITGASSRTGWAHSGGIKTSASAGCWPRRIRSGTLDPGPGNSGLTGCCYLLLLGFAIVGFSHQLKQNLSAFIIHLCHPDGDSLIKLEEACALGGFQPQGDGVK